MRNPLNFRVFLQNYIIMVRNAGQGICNRMQKEGSTFQRFPREKWDIMVRRKVCFLVKSKLVGNMADPVVIRRSVQELPAEKTADQLAVDHNRRGKITQSGMAMVGNRPALVRRMRSTVAVTRPAALQADRGRTRITGAKIRLAGSARYIIPVSVRNIGSDPGHFRKRVLHLLQNGNIDQVC